MFKKILYITIILISICNIKLSNSIKIVTNNNSINRLIIKKININKRLYNIDSKENTIEKHISYLKGTIMPDKENSIVILAAHSGTGKIAYFQELDKLQKNDIVILIYNNKKYKYIVKDIWEQKKNGYININKEKEKQLVLTTCSPNKNNYQLIVNCIEKEST